MATDVDNEDARSRWRSERESPSKEEEDSQVGLIRVIIAFLPF